MTIEQAEALEMICYYAKEHLKDNEAMSQSVDIAKGIIKQELKALNEILALHDKWLGNEMSDFEFFTLLSEIKYKYGLSKI